MVDLEEFRQLKSSVDRARREKDKAQGSLIEVQKRIKEEFGCKTLSAAEGLLKQYQKDAADIEEQYDKDLTSLRKEWGDGLEWSL